MEKVNELLKTRQFHLAEKVLEGELLDAPLCPQANIALAAILTNTNRAAFSDIHFERAKSVDGDTPKIALTQASNLRAQTKIAESIARFREAVALDDKNPAAWGGLIGALEADGLLDEAKTVIADADNKFPVGPEIRRFAAQVYADGKDYERAISLLPDGSNLRPMELFDRGRYRDKLGLYNEAWTDWMRAKGILQRHAGHRYQGRIFTRLVNDLYELSLSDRYKFVADAPERFVSETCAPLFVTGFPRSGTTMIETVIACHHHVVAADELQFLHDTIELLPRLLDLNVPYPKCLTATSYGNHFAVLPLARQFYLLRSYRKLGEDAYNKSYLFFTDKMPLNEIHLPLINALFPDSPVVYVRRHPLDMIVSNMSYYITHGHYYASGLMSAARAYLLVDRLMQHYKKKFPTAFIEVSYEAFVSDQKKETDAMMSKIGLSSEPAQYNFHLDKRHSRTISYRQIKEPLYDTSVGRYKNYLTQLAPVLEILRPVCEREGYEI
jgi:tetratricopeptide (TPR) repeat protein